MIRAHMQMQHKDNYVYEGAKKTCNIAIIIPGLKRCGGNDVIFKLKKNSGADVISLFGGENDYPDQEVHVLINKNFNKLNYIAYSIFFLLYFLIHRRYNVLILTHILTWPLSFLVRPERTHFFVQGKEWEFFGWLSKLLFLLLRSRIKKAQVITTNIFLGQELHKLGLPQYSIFLPLDIPEPKSMVKMFDYLVIRRSGEVKNSRKTDELISRLPDRSSVKIVNLSTNVLENRDNQIVVRGPVSHQEMINVISESRIIFILSRSEGLSLPVIEAVSLGTIPVILENGITENLIDQTVSPVFPQGASLDVVIEQVEKLLSNKELMSEVISRNRESLHAFESYHKAKTLEFIENLNDLKC